MYQDIVNHEYFVWVAGPAALIVWVSFFALLKNYIFNKARRRLSNVESSVIDLLLDSLKFPLNLIILLSGIYIMEKALSLPQKADEIAVYAIKILIILSVVFFVDQLLRGALAMKALKSEAFSSAQGIVQGIVRAFILVIGALVILEAMGVTITPILASLGIGSLAIALALRDTLANLFAGIFLIMDKPVKVGQYIKLETGERGYIEDIGLRSTRIRTRRDITIVIPNDRIVNSIISNYHQPTEEFSYRIEIGVSYDSDLEHVERVTMEVAANIQNNHPGAVQGFKPYMRYHSFGDSAILFFVNLRVKGYHTRRGVMHQFIKELHRAYKKEGIEIPFPQRTLTFAAEQKKPLSDIASKIREQR